MNLQNFLGSDPPDFLSWVPLAGQEYWVIFDVRHTGKTNAVKCNGHPKVAIVRRYLLAIPRLVGTLAGGLTLDRPLRWIKRGPRSPEFQAAK